MRAGCCATAGAGASNGTPGAKPVGACCDGPPTAADLNPLGIRRLAKVTLATDDLDASMRWWDEKMGMDRGARLNTRFGTVQRMSYFNGWITIDLLHPGPSGRPQRRGPVLPDPYAHTAIHGMSTQVVFSCKNNTEALRVLAGRGVNKCAASIVNPIAGLKLAFVRDPTTGVLVQFLEAVDPALTSTAVVPTWITDTDEEVANPLGILGYSQVSKCVVDIEASIKWSDAVLGVYVPHGYGYIDLVSAFGTIIALGRTGSSVRTENILNQTSIPYPADLAAARRFPNQASVTGIAALTYVVSVPLHTARDFVAHQVAKLNMQQNTSYPGPTEIYDGTSFFIEDCDGILLEFQERLRTQNVAGQRHFAATSTMDVQAILRTHSGWPLGGETSAMQVMNTATGQVQMYTGRERIAAFWTGYFGTGFDVTQCKSTHVQRQVHDHGFWSSWQCPQHGISWGSDSVTYDSDNLIKSQAVYLYWPGMDIETWQPVPSQSSDVCRTTGFVAAIAVLAPFAAVGAVWLALLGKTFIGARRALAESAGRYRGMSA